MLTPCVPCLFGSRSPAAIGGGVPLLIVDAINAAVGRTFAHVGEKVVKYIPSFADGNAAPTVVFVRSCLGVAAAGYHAGPRHESRGSSFVAGVPVLEVVALFKQAATGFRVAAGQAAAAHDKPVPASADAVPVPPPMLIPMGEAEHCQATEVPTCNIDELGHVPLMAHGGKQFKMSNPPTRPGV
jgi:hypothetical protein